MAETKDINPLTGKPWGEAAKVAETKAAVEKQSINPVTGLQWGALSKASYPTFNDYSNQNSRITTTESTLPFKDDISKYTDYGVPLGRNLDWDEIRAQNQSTAEQWGRGIAKAGATFTGAFAENTIGVVAGLGSMLMGDPYRDNVVGKLVDESNEWMRENYANYYTKEQQESTKVWSANFWADGVLNGLAYSAASLASVYATGGVGLTGLAGKAAILTGIAAKSAKMYKTAKAVTTGTKLANILQKGAKVGTRSLNAFKMAEVGFYMGLAESSVEARETSKAALENLTEEYMQENNIFSMSDIPAEEMQRMKDTSEAAGNTNFAINLAITTGTNAFMFGKMALGYKGAIKSLKGLTYDSTKKKIIDTIEEKGLKKVVVDKVFGVSENILGEAVQEGGQYASNLYSLDIHTQKYKDTGVIDRVQAINSALTQTIGDKEGRESILIGAIIGGIMGAGSLFRPTDAQNGEKQRKLMQSQLQKIVDGGYFHDVQQKVEGENLAAILATKMEAALQAGNIKEFKDLQSDFILAKVSSIIKNGGLDVLLEQLDDTSSFTDEEFMKHFGFPLEDADGKPYKLEDHLGEESKSQFVEGLRNKVKDVKQVYDNVDDLFPLRQITKGLPALFMSKEERAAEIATYNTRKILRDQLMLSGYGIKDRNRRMKSMINDLEDVLKKDPIIDSLFGDALSTKLNEIKSLESTPFDEESLKDIEAAFLKREEKLAALFESLEQGAGIANIETANKIKAIKEDYLEMSAENAFALDIYNKLISDQFYRKTFEDNVKKAQDQSKAEEFAKQVENVIKNSNTSRELEDNRPNANDLSEEQKENLRLRKKQLEEQEAEAKAKYEEEIEAMTPEEAVEYLKKAKKNKKTSATDIVGINAVLADLENNEGAQSAKEKIFPSSAQQASSEKSIKELDKKIARKKGVLKRSNLKEQTRKDIEEELKDLEAQREALLAEPQEQEKELIADNKVPVKREVIRVTEDDGSYVEYTVTTNLDGSLNDPSGNELKIYDENGNLINTQINPKLIDEDIRKRDGLTALDAIKIISADTEVVTVESTQSGAEFINRTKLDRLTPEQRKKFEEQTGQSADNAEVEVEDVDSSEDVNDSDPEFEGNDSPDIGDRDTGPEFSEEGVPDPQGKEGKDYSAAAKNPSLSLEDLKKLQAEREEIKKQLKAAQEAEKKKNGKGVVIQESGKSKNAKDNLRNVAEEYGIMPNKKHTVSELLGFIEKHGNYQTRLILSIIKKFAKQVGVSIRFEFDSEYTGIKGTSATYYPNTAAGSAEIVVKLSNLFAPATAARVLVHELVHAVTYELIDSVNKGKFSSRVKKVYQGYTAVDNRKINYYTVNKSEAADYGKNVREVYVDTSGMLSFKNDQRVYYELKKEFSESSGKTFDLLDNSSEGLQTQNEFFKFLENKGYTGIDFTGSTDSQYVISFQNNLETAPPVKFSLKQIEAAKKLKALLKTIKSDPDFKNSYGAKDEFELLAELTNPTFVKKLKNKFVNFIQKIYEYVADILGVKKSAYDEAVSILQDMVDFPEEANTVTVEQARRYKEKQFLEDFNFTVEEYESLKNALGYDHSEMVDLLAKVVAVEEGGNLDTATAYVAFKLLGKESSKLRSELRYRVHGWSEFRDRFDYHAKEINEKFGYVEGQDVWKRMVLDRVVVDYLAETIVAYDANPKEFEKQVDKKWTQKDFTFIKKLWRAITGFLKKKGILKTPKKDMEVLENISNQQVHEILNREDDVFDLQLEEGQVQKYYEETIATDPFAEKLVQFAQSLELILTGSLALRRAGSVYRTIKESLHDLDFVVKYSSIQNPKNRKVLNKLRKIHAKYPRTKSRKSLEAASAESLEAVKDLDWYKEFLKGYPSYKPFSSFYGAEHDKYESFTVLGAVNGEYYEKAGFHKVKQADGTVKRKFHNKGDYIRGTGYQVDFFIRLQPNQDEHDGYFKLWKEVMIAKLKMGRLKDLTDWKYFIPFVKSHNSYNFYHPEWTYATGKSKRVGLGAKINKIEELQRQLEEKEKAIEDAEAQLQPKNPTPKAGTSSPSGMEKQNDAPFRTKIKNAYYAVLDKFGNADRMISGYGPVTIAKNPPLYEKDFETAESDILLPDTDLLLKSLGKSAEFRLGNGETWFIEEYGKEGLDLSSPEDYVDKFAYDVPIHIYVDNQFVGRLEAGNITNLVERKSIIRDLAKGETVNRKVTRVVATNPNYSRTVNNETGEVQPIFLDPRKTFNYENLNIAAVSLDRGVWSIKTKNSEIDNELANQNIGFDNLEAGSIAFIVDPKDTATGEVNFVKAQTRNLTKGVQKRIIEKLKDKEDENRLDDVAEVVANEAPKDSISETYLNFDQFGEDGSKFIVFKSPKLRRMVRVNEDELSDSLNGIPAVQSLVFFNKDTERWQTDRRSKAPKSTKYNVGKDFINFLKNKKYQIDVQKANENLPYTNSIVELAPGSTYQDYLFNPIEDNEGPEVGHSSILRTDVQRIDGSIYHDLGVTFASGTRTKEAQSVMADVVDSTPKDQGSEAAKLGKLKSRLKFKNKLKKEVEENNCTRTKIKK